MAIVLIGTMFDLTDPDNPVALPGYHVDSLEPIEGASEFLIEPKNPRHVFSGVEVSYRYRFDNKEQAESILQLIE